MGQAGRLVVCGDAGDALGDSLYEARIYVRGKVASLGADCVRKRCAPSISPNSRNCSTPAGFDARAGRIQALRLGPQLLQLPRRQRRRVLRTVMDAHP